MCSLQKHVTNNWCRSAENRFQVNRLWDISGRPPFPDSVFWSLHRPAWSAAMVVFRASTPAAALRCLGRGTLVRNTEFYETALKDRVNLVKQGGICLWQEDRLSGPPSNMPALEIYVY